MGRHSLLWWQLEHCPGLVVSSTACRVHHPSAREVPAIGVFVASISTGDLAVRVHHWNTTTTEIASQYYLAKDFIFTPDISDVKILSPYPISNLKIPKDGDAFLEKLRSLASVPNLNINNFLGSLLQDPDILQRVQKFYKVLLDSVEIRCKSQPQLCKSCVSDLSLFLVALNHMLDIDNLGKFLI
jgi:hypothetical protein